MYKYNSSSVTQMSHWFIAKTISLLEFNRNENINCNLRWKSQQFLRIDGYTQWI